LSVAELYQSANVGILGGTFDPVHHGHLIAAEWVRECLSLDKVLLVPCASPPHKSKGAVASPAERLEMLRLATRFAPQLEVSDVELSRGGRSYTIATLRHLKSQLPKARLFLILGSDAFSEIETWKDYEQIFLETSFAVMLRSGYALHEVISRVNRRLADGLAHAPHVDSPVAGEEALKRGSNIIVVHVPQVELSGSMIRRNVQKGRSIQYMVPEAVLEYIKNKGLYRGD